MKRPIHRYIPYIVKVAVDERRGPFWDVFNMFPDGHGSPFRDRSYAGDIATGAAGGASSGPDASSTTNPSSAPSTSSASPSYVSPAGAPPVTGGLFSGLHIKVPGGPEINFGPGGPSLGGFPGAFPSGTRVIPLTRPTASSPSAPAAPGRTYTEEDLRRRQAEIDAEVAADRASRDHADSLIDGAIAERERNARAWKLYRKLHGLGLAGGAIGGFYLGKGVNHLLGLDDSNHRTMNGFLANAAIKGLGTIAGAVGGHYLTKLIRPKDLSGTDVVYSA